MTASVTNQARSVALEAFVAAARRIVGDGNVLESERDCKLYSTDFSEIELAVAAAVVRPSSTQEVAALVAAAHGEGVPIVARGGGMSYSLAYVPARPGTVVFDMTRMNRILEINVEDLRVTVETGVTWQQLHAALAPTGFRIPFLGTYSGEKATVGGGLGNNATGHGALDIADFLLGMEVVLPDGRLLQTGARAHAPDEPIVRGYGPDLTGLFTHDAGAFGIKTRASFRLVRKPQGTAYRSYGFRDEGALIEAMCAVTRLGIATDMTSFSDYHHRVFANQPRPPADEARAFARAVIAGAASRGRGLLHLATLARGMGFLLRWPWSVTIVIENWSQHAADKGAREIDRTMKRFGATRIRPSLGIALRAQPFVPIGTLMVGLDGASSFPSNFTVPLSRARQLADEARAFFAENAAEMQRHGIYVATLHLCFKGAFGMEPIIYWPDRLNALRYETASPSLREKFGGQPERPDARACAIDLRRRLIARLERLHPAHYQTGKLYPYREAVASHAGWSLLEGFKRQVDPHERVNPGALGFRSSPSP